MTMNGVMDEFLYQLVVDDGLQLLASQNVANYGMRDISMHLLQYN